MGKRYNVNFVPDADGWWVVTVAGVPGVVTQAKSVDQGLTRVREALGLIVGDAAASAELEPRIRVSPAERAAIARARRLQRQAEEASKAAAEASRTVVRTLRARMSTRDVAHTVGMSPARVGQLEHD